MCLSLLYLINASEKISIKRHVLIGVRAGGGQGGPTAPLKILEYHIIRATNLQRFGQKELHNLAVA